MQKDRRFVQRFILVPNSVMYENNMPDRRYRKTLSLMKTHLPAPARIMDLGWTIHSSEIMRKEGYTVDNTGGEDLDEEVSLAKATGYDAVTAFEILEHLLSPYTLLKSIEAPKSSSQYPECVVSGPHRNPKDPRDNHYHEFYPIKWTGCWIRPAGR